MQENNIKVSVIIPVYNVEQYLAQCLDSVINQTLKEIEIICVDDGSTDSSVEVIRSYCEKDQRVKLMTQENKHAGVARNTGMTIATGKYYIFLDADDFFEPDLLEATYDECEKHGADIAVFGADKYDTVKEEYEPAPWLLNLDIVPENPFNKFIVPNLYHVTAPNPWTKLFRAEFVKAHNLKFQALERSNDAYFVMSALALADKIVGVDKVLVHYRVGQTNNLQSHNARTPDAFCQALEAIKNKLVESGVYEYVEQSFVNSVAAQLQYNLQKLEGKKAGYNALIGSLNNKYIEFFELEKYPRAFYFSEFYYNYITNALGLKYTPHIDDEENDIKVSILIPVHNTESYLERCLDSVLGQTLTDIEVICVDDGSTDGSNEILQRYATKDNRLTVIRIEGSGPFVARRVATNASSGAYIMFVDADDYIEKEAAELLYNTARQRRVDILQFDTQVEAHHSVQPQRVKNIEKLLAPHKGLLLGNILSECYIQHKFRFSLWNKFYRSSIVKQAYAMLRNDILYRGEDLYLFFAISYLARSYLGIADKLYHYSFGYGMTGKRRITLEQFKNVCDQYIVSERIKELLVANKAYDKFKKAHTIIHSELLSDVFTNFENYLDPEYKKEALEMIFEHWDKTAICRTFASKYRFNQEIPAKMMDPDTLFSTKKSCEIKTIAIFYHRLTVGGVQRVIALQIPTFIKMGYKVVLITDEKPTPDDYEIPEGVKRVVISDRMLPESRINELVMTLKENNVDLFLHHSTSDPFLFFDIITAKSCGIPVAIVIHEAFVAQVAFSRPVIANKHFIYRFADVAITLSKVQEAYWRSLGVNARCILNPMTYTIAERPEESKRCNNILWVGRIADDKNCVDAVRILAKVREQVPDATLTIVGKAISPEKAHELNGLISYYMLEDAVILAGETANVDPYYKSASVYLLTSLAESFSMTLAESKMYSLPAVIYDLPYIDLCNAEFGTIAAEQQNVNDAADKIVRLMTSPEYMQKNCELSLDCAKWLVEYNQEDKWASLIGEIESGKTAPPQMSPTMTAIAESLFYHFSLSCKNRPAAPSRVMAASINSEEEPFHYKSYKIGCLITYIPRKIIGGIKCLKEHGFRYTMRRIKEKFLGLFSKNKSE